MLTDYQVFPLFRKLNVVWLHQEVRASGDPANEFRENSRPSILPTVNETQLRDMILLKVEQFFLETQRMAIALNFLVFLFGLREISVVNNLTNRNKRFLLVGYGDHTGEREPWDSTYL